MAKTSICVVLPMAQTSLVRVINGYFDFRAGGFPSAGRPGEAARLLGKARRPATQRTFNSRVSRYCSWCREQQVECVCVRGLCSFISARPLERFTTGSLMACRYPEQGPLVKCDLIGAYSDTSDPARMALDCGPCDELKSWSSPLLTYFIRLR